MSEIERVGGGGWKSCRILNLVPFLYSCPVQLGILQ